MVSITLPFSIQLFRDFTVLFVGLISVAAPKRFYQNVDVLSCDGKYEIVLDNKKLKTPTGAVFTVASEPLAIASKPQNLNIVFI